MAIICYRIRFLIRNYGLGVPVNQFLRIWSRWRSNSGSYIIWQKRHTRLIWLETATPLNNVQEKFTQYIFEK